MLLSFPQKEMPALAALASFSELKSDRLQVFGSGLAAAPIGLHIKRKLLALVEITHASTLDCRNVNEHIGAAVVLNDKAIALLGIEEFNSASGHQGLLIKRANASLPIQTISHGSDIRILRVLGEGR
jgi:hypothetical protein